MATSKKEESKAVVAAGAAVPDFLKDHMADSRGNEEVSSADLVIPRIELCQSLSEARKKASPDYIEGIEEGDLYNNVTRVIYGDHLSFIPVYFRVEFLVWRNQKLGGGFAGSYPSAREAEAARREQEKPDEWEVIDTNVHFVLILLEDGRLEEAVISMAKTKAKVSRLFNSLVRLNGGPRFSRVYRLSGVPDQNSAGQDYFNLAVRNVGFVTEPQFKIASDLYDLIIQGKVKMDTSGAEGGESAKPDHDDEDHGF